MLTEQYYERIERRYRYRDCRIEIMFWRDDTSKNVVGGWHWYVNYPNATSKGSTHAIDASEEAMAEAIAAIDKYYDNR